MGISSNEIALIVCTLLSIPLAYLIYFFGGQRKLEVEMSSLEYVLVCLNKDSQQELVKKTIKRRIERS